MAELAVEVRAAYVHLVGKTLHTKSLVGVAIRQRGVDLGEEGFLQGRARGRCWAGGARRERRRRRGRCGGLTFRTDRPPFTPALALVDEIINDNGELLGVEGFR